jgi:inner membrane protein involved in colicin E2 resistance
MRIGRSRWHWYDFIIVGLAFAIVYPDKILNWISERTGKTYGWKHLIWLEVIAIGLLMPSYPNLEWWYPLMVTAALGLVRAIMKFLMTIFGLD